MITVQDPQKTKKALFILLGALVLVFILFSVNFRNEAKTKIKENDKTISQLKKDKAAILKDLKASNKALKQKDSIILVLSKKENYFINNLKNQKNENIKNRFEYLNSSNDKRFELFSRLATEKSNARD